MPDSAIVAAERDTGVMRSVSGLTPEKASEAALKESILLSERGDDDLRQFIAEPLL